MKHHIAQLKVQATVLAVLLECCVLCGLEGSGESVNEMHALAPSMS
jgi:hypothetical protein